MIKSLTYKLARPKGRVWTECPVNIRSPASAAQGRLPGTKFLGTAHKCDQRFESRHIDQ